MKEIKDYYKIMLDSSQEIFLIYEKKTLKILYANQRLEEVFQIPAHSIYEKPDLMYEKMIKKNTFQSHLEQISQKNQSSDFSLSFSLNDKILYFNAFFFPIDSKSIGLRLTDVSEKKMTEQKLFESEKARSRLNYLIGHDLKNPLVGIKGLSDFIHSDLKNNNLKEAEQSISFIQEASRNYLAIVEAVSRSVKLYYSDFPLEKTHNCLIALIESCILSFRKQSEPKEIEVIFEPEDETLIADFDLTALKEIFSQIFSNALKFSYKKGKIILSIEKKERFIEISVADEGIAIPESIKNHIFEPFTDSKRLGTAGEHSVGIGLAIAKRLALLHGLEIDFESEEKKGTRFMIRIPY